MVDHLLVEQFHNAFDVEPRAGSFERLRATLIAVDISSRKPASVAIRLPRGWFRAAAIAALVALAIASVGAFVALHSYVHRSVLVHPGPFKVRAPGAAVCMISCEISDATFVSTTVGFVIEGSTAACATSCPPQTTYLYRTLDGGDHWEPIFSTSLDCCGSGRLMASPDGKQLLVLGTRNGKTILASNSGGGSNWSSYSLPSDAGKATQTICAPATKGGSCSQAKLSPQVYFLDQRQGWALSQEQSYGIADLYRTTNAGAGWVLVGRIDLHAQFGLNLGGVSGTGDTVDHMLRGQFIFGRNAVAWFIPQGSSLPQFPRGGTRVDALRLFRSTDGGLTWKALAVVASAEVAASDPGAMSLKFFNDHQGVLELVVSPPSGGSIVEKRFVYTTSDGGTTWSSAIAVPQPSRYASMRYVDMQHWVGWPYGGGWISTSDGGQHWQFIADKVQFEERPVADGGLPPQLPASYPLRDMFGFLDASHGWALPYQGRDPNVRGVALFVTNDGGVNWHPVGLPELL
jgi:hypothetical protein